MGELHHAMRETESLRIAFRLDQPGSAQGLQQAIERGPAEADALLNLEHAERRLVRRETLQDGDGAVDRADRRARSFVFLIVDGH